jgi:Domain of unknown function (DUF6438)
MKSIYLLLLSLIAGTFAECKGAKKTPAEQAPTQLVSIQTQGCRGYCPRFKADFFSDGTVRYEGIQFVEKMGTATVTLTKSELGLLNKQLETTNLWQYPERFPTTVADAPGATLTVYRGQEQKVVMGSLERPKPILALDNMLRDLLEAHQIPVRKGVNPEAPDPNSRKTILVLLKPEINAGNWIAEVKDLRVQLIRRVTADNLWLVGFDPQQISEAALIERLKKMPAVLEAQTNQEVDERH